MQADFPLRPSPGRERSQQVTAPSETLSAVTGKPSCSSLQSPAGSRAYPLAHSRGKNSELIAILRDGATRDLNSAFAEDVDDRLIGEWMLWIFFLHELLELRLDTARGDVFALRRREAG